MTTKAPFPVDKFYGLGSGERIHFNSPLQQELVFIRKLTQHIPPNYLQTVESTLMEVQETIFKKRGKQVKFWCDVFRIHVSYKGKITLHFVELRPCAEGCGFYQLILEWLMRLCALNDCHFCIEGCLEQNCKIVKHYGFHHLVYEEGDDNFGNTEDYGLSSDECKTFDYVSKFRIHHKIHIVGEGNKLILRLIPGEWISAADLNDFYKTQERYYSKLDINQKNNPVLDLLMRDFLYLPSMDSTIAQRTYLDQQKRMALENVERRYGKDYVLDFDHVQESTSYFPGIEHYDVQNIDFNFLDKIVKQGALIPELMMQMYVQNKKRKEVMETWKLAQEKINFLKSKERDTEWLLITLRQQMELGIEPRKEDARGEIILLLNAMLESLGDIQNFLGVMKQKVENLD